MLLISGERDNTGPPAITNGTYRLQKRNTAVTELKQLPGRGHSLVFDAGWTEVAETALAFIKRYH